MTINLKIAEAPIRENRLNSITGYTGTIQDLVKQAACGSLQNKERCFTQTSACSSGCAQFILTQISDAAIVNHAPLGCIADSVGCNVSNKWGENVRHWERQNIRVLNTNMTDEDTVFGAVQKLKEAVKEAYRRFQPKAIFVTASCVSGIIGEDIQSVLDELADEIPIPLAPVFAKALSRKSGPLVLMPPFMPF